jgi:hypothetical protein
MRYSLLLPMIFLGLTGCVVDRTSPAPATTTYVTPVPAATYASPTYVTPMSPPGTTTVIRTP